MLFLNDNEIHFLLCGQVYIELEQHGEYVKTITDTQLKRLKEVEQCLSKLEKNGKGVEDRINRAFKVYELLEQRAKNFEALPAANRKPLSKAEREFNSDLGILTSFLINNTAFQVQKITKKILFF